MILCFHSSKGIGTHLSKLTDFCFLENVSNLFKSKGIMFFCDFSSEIPGYIRILLDKQKVSILELINSLKENLKLLSNLKIEMVENVDKIRIKKILTRNSDNVIAEKGKDILEHNNKIKDFDFIHQRMIRQIMFGMCMADVLKIFKNQKKVFEAVIYDTHKEETLVYTNVFS